MNNIFVFFLFCFFLVYSLLDLLFSLCAAPQITTKTTWTTSHQTHTFIYLVVVMTNSNDADDKLNDFIHLHSLEGSIVSVCYYNCFLPFYFLVIFFFYLSSSWPDSIQSLTSQVLPTSRRQSATSLPMIFPSLHTHFTSIYNNNTHSRRRLAAKPIVNNIIAHTRSHSSSSYTKTLTRSVPLSAAADRPTIHTISVCYFLFYFLSILFAEDTKKTFMPLRISLALTYCILYHIFS